MISSILHIILLIYGVVMVCFMIGFFLKDKLVRSKAKGRSKLSVILPVRNESKHCLKTIEEISKQQNVLFELIVVDDFSDDDTYKIVEDYIADKEYIRLISSEKEGKKAAVTTGINHATGSIIVTTDADCTMCKTWLKTIVEHHEKFQWKLLILPVSLKKKNTWFNDFERMEWLVLQGITASSVKLGQPMMCNGANLAFEKSAFLEVRGYEGNENFFTGDDTFLLNKIRQKDPKNIGYCNDISAMVHADSANDFNHFINQRIRWSSKIREMKNLGSKLFGAIIFLTNIALVVSTLLLLFGEFSASVAHFLIVKIVVDFIFIMLTSIQLKQRFQVLFPVYSLIYPFYLVFVGCLSFLVNPTWKGRKVIH